MTISVQKPPNPVRVSAEGTVLTSVVGTSDVSAQGGVLAVSARNTIDVSARQIDVSAHGIVSAGGTVDVSAQGGVVATSVRNTADVSAQGGNFSVSARNTVDVSGQGGAITTSARNVVTVSANTGIVNVSAQGGSVTVSAQGGRIGTYFKLPASLITDGSQAEDFKAINVSGASAGTYALVSAPASGTWRISRLMLAFTSATFVTFRRMSAAASAINFSGPMSIDNRGSIVLDKSDSPWFVGTGTKNFSVNVSAGVGIAGTVWWY